MLYPYFDSSADFLTMQYRIYRRKLPCQKVVRSFTDFDTVPAYDDDTDHSQRSRIIFPLLACNDLLVNCGGLILRRPVELAS